MPVDTTDGLFPVRKGEIVVVRTEDSYQHLDGRPSTKVSYLLAVVAASTRAGRCKAIQFSPHAHPRKRDHDRSIVEVHSMGGLRDNPALLAAWQEADVIHGLPVGETAEQAREWVKTTLEPYFTN